MSYIGEIRKLVGNRKIISVSCGAIIENENNEILLQLRSDTKNYGVPGGNIELGETLLETLEREIKEETNISINPNNVSLFGIYSGEKCLTVYPNHDEVQYVCVIFYVKVKNITKLIIDSESDSINFFSRNNLPHNIKDSDIIWVTKWKNKNMEIEID